MRWKVRFWQDVKWHCKAGFYSAPDALVYARDLSARWPKIKVALFNGAHLDDDFIFLNGKRITQE